MPFILSPLLDTMIDLYGKPRSMERFREYLNILQGTTKEDMVVPVGNFNPMGKEHLLEKLEELKKLNAEELMKESLSEINGRIDNKLPSTFKVSIAVADDLKGAWTNRYTTDYDSKFKLNALITRNFCTPLFWTSETFSEELVKTRTLEYCLRTLYWLNAPKPQTLAQHIAQERFAAGKSFRKKAPECDFASLEQFYIQHKDSERYDIIFNFLYGDAACKELGFPAYGISDAFGGYKYAIASRNS
ncbi:MAG: hypothetical protein JWO44_76 [Bacteroidetes bacterium]|nr:hypothetical protein [Bacteroidota bacterium]